MQRSRRRVKASWRQRLPRSVKLLGYTSLFTDAATEAIYPLLPIFVTRVLGGSAASLGLIEGAADATSSILKLARRTLVRSDRPAQAVRARRLRHCRPGAAAYRAGDESGNMSFSFELPIASARDCAARRATPCSARWRRRASADACSDSIAPWITRAQWSGRCSPRRFSTFAPGEYRTLFALTIVPGLLAIAMLLIVPDRSGRLPRPSSGGAHAAQPASSGAEALSGDPCALHARQLERRVSAASPVGCRSGQHAPAACLGRPPRREIEPLDARRHAVGSAGGGGP